jgi:uncharacterized membrane protein
MYPRARLDTLTDGLFAVAMTLLVLDLRLPDGFQPHDANDLVQGVIGLAPKFLPYVLSFGVLGLRWLSGIQVRSPDEDLGSAYVHWWLLYLLFVTCFPFVTIVVGRFPDLAPAIWFYAGNTLILSVIGLRLLALIPDVEPGKQRDHQFLLAVLIVSSGLAIVVSFIDPRHALWPYALGFAVLVITNRLREWRLKGDHDRAQ